MPCSPHREAVCWCVIHPSRRTSQTTKGLWKCFDCTLWSYRRGRLILSEQSVWNVNLNSTVYFIYVTCSAYVNVILSSWAQWNTKTDWIGRWLTLTPQANLLQLKTWCHYKHDSLDYTHTHNTHMHTHTNNIEQFLFLSFWSKRRPSKTKAIGEVP